MQYSAIREACARVSSKKPKSTAIHFTDCPPRGVGAPRASLDFLQASLLATKQDRSGVALLGLSAPLEEVPSDVVAGVCWYCT